MIAPTNSDSVYWKMLPSMRFRMFVLPRQPMVFVPKNVPRFVSFIAMMNISDIDALRPFATTAIGS